MTRIDFTLVSEAAQVARFKGWHEVIVRRNADDRLSIEEWQDHKCYGTEGDAREARRSDDR